MFKCSFVDTRHGKLANNHTPEGKDKVWKTIGFHAVASRITMRSILFNDLEPKSYVMHQRIQHKDHVDWICEFLVSFPAWCRQSVCQDSRQTPAMDHEQDENRVLVGFSRSSKFYWSSTRPTTAKTCAYLCSSRMYGLVC